MNSDIIFNETNKNPISPNSPNMNYDLYNEMYNSNNNNQYDFINLNESLNLSLQDNIDYKTLEDIPTQSISPLPSIVHIKKSTKNLKHAQAVAKIRMYSIYFI